jgi:hypothetical protein
MLIVAQLIKKFPTLFVSSALKMETVCFSETLASTNEYTWHQNPEEQHNYETPFLEFSPAHCYFLS